MAVVDFELIFKLGVESESGCTILDSVTGMELLETVSGLSVDKSGVSSHSKFPVVVSELSLTSA